MRHTSRLLGSVSGSIKTVAPVVLNPDIASKKASAGVAIPGTSTSK